MEINEITDRVLAAAVEVHRRLGPGLLESPYAQCLAFEMRRGGLRFQREVRLPLVYDGHRIDCAYRLDFFVEGQMVLEIKAVRSLEPIHGAQLLTYLRLGGFAGLGSRGRVRGRKSHDHRGSPAAAVEFPPIWWRIHHHPVPGRRSCAIFHRIG